MTRPRFGAFVILRGIRLFSFMISEECIHQSKGRLKNKRRPFFVLWRCIECNREGG